MRVSMVADLENLIYVLLWLLLPQEP